MKEDFKFICLHENGVRIALNIDQILKVEKIDEENAVIILPDERRVYIDESFEEVIACLPIIFPGDM